MRNHFNHNYSGGIGSIPLSIGDRYYNQDIVRDFWYVMNESGRLMKALFGETNTKISGGFIKKGSTFSLIDISICLGVVQFSVEVPLSFASLPPTSLIDPLDGILVESTAQTDFSLASATLDGATVNYVKLKYTEVDGLTRTKAKKAGSYVYEVSPGFTIFINTDPPSTEDIQLGTVVGDGSTFLTIVNDGEWGLEKLYLDKIFQDDSQVADLYEGSGELYEMTSPVLASNTGEEAIFSSAERNGNTGFGKIFADRGCYYFNGVNSWLELPTQLQNEDSIELWIFPNWGATPGENQVIVHTMGGVTDTDDYVFLRFTTTNIYQLSVQDSTGNRILIESGVIGAPDVLTHLKIAWSKAGNVAKLIINGVDQGSGTTTGTGISAINMTVRAGFVIGSENSSSFPSGSSELANAWLTDFLIHSSYDITDTHFTAAKPYFTKTRIMGKNTDTHIDEHGNIGASALWMQGRKVVESGSNANGEYIIFSDGSVMQVTTGISVTTNASLGVLFYHSTGDTAIFPIVFGAVPLIAIGANNLNTNQPVFAGRMNATAIDVAITTLSSINGEQGSMRCLAIGVL